MSHVQIRRAYENVVIRLRDWRRGRFAVEVTDSPVGRMRAPAYVYFDPHVVEILQRLDRQDTRNSRSVVTLRELRELGEMLAAMLFPRPVNEIVRKSQVWVRRRIKHLDMTGKKPPPVPALRIVPEHRYARTLHRAVGVRVRLGPRAAQVASRGPLEGHAGFGR